MRRRAGQAVGVLHLSVMSCITVTLLGGCISGAGIEPDASFIDPATIDPGNALREAAREVDWPTGEWWKSWRDPQLDGLMASAVRGNPALAIVRSRVTAAIWEARALRADLLPDVEGTAALARRDDLHHHVDFQAVGTLIRLGNALGENGRCFVVIEHCQSLSERRAQGRLLCSACK